MIRKKLAELIPDDEREMASLLAKSIYNIDQVFNVLDVDDLTFGLFLLSEKEQALTQNKYMEEKQTSYLQSFDWMIQNQPRFLELRYFVEFANMVYIDDEAQLRKSLEKYGQIVKVRTKAKVGKPSHFVALLEPTPKTTQHERIGNRSYHLDQTTLLIAIRGTYSAQDALTDILVDTMPWNPSEHFKKVTSQDSVSQKPEHQDPWISSILSTIGDLFWRARLAVFPEVGGGEVQTHSDGQLPEKLLCHSGMGESALWLLKTLRPIILEQVKLYNQRSGAEKKPLNIVVCGHSLGAGTSSLFTTLLDEDPDLKEVTYIRSFAFASPQIISSDLLSRIDSTRYLTVNNKYDVVPRASIATACGLFEQCITFEDSRHDVCKKILKRFEQFRQEGRRLLELKPLQPGEHELTEKELSEKKINELKAKQALLPKLYSAGDIIFLNTNVFSKHTRALPLSNVDTFQHIVMCSSMLKDHSVTTYMQRLDALLERIQDIKANPSAASLSAYSSDLN